MGMVLCVRRASSEELAKLRANPDAANNFLFDGAAYESGDLVDFDKAWNALHFMFTGCDADSDHPLSLFPNDPERIGTDNGYGGPWVYSHAQVAAFNEALSELSDEELGSRYDPTAMLSHNVYLAETLSGEGDEGLEYVLQSVPRLRALVARCAQTQAAMVGIIT